MREMISSEFDAHIKTSNLIHNLIDEVAFSAQLCIDCINNNGKILLFGNGGSAADAQHIAAELVGRYKLDRKGFPAIALTTDTSILTSVANDYSYINIFDRQVEALANKGDVIIGISTGGNSENVISALKIASHLKCKTIGLSGRGGGIFNDICDVNIIAPSIDTPRIQEIHIVIGHTICHIIEQTIKG
jgi:D-sedoheptulose 7-phosphate isomerase